MQLVRFWLIMHEHWKTEWRCLTFLWMSLTFASLPTFWQDYVALSTKADAGHPSQWQELLGWSSLAKSSVASRSFWGDNFIDKAFTVMSFGVREALGIGLPKMRVFFYRVISSSRNMKCDFFEVFLTWFLLTSNIKWLQLWPLWPLWHLDFKGLYRDRQ